MSDFCLLQAKKVDIHQMLQLVPAPPVPKTYLTPILGATLSPHRRKLAQDRESGIHSKQILYLPRMLVVDVMDLLRVQYRYTAWAAVNRSDARNRSC